MSEVVIKVENLSKLYRLGVTSTGTLSHDLNRLWAKMRGQEDPYSKIGEVNDRSIKGESDYVWALKDINFEVNQGEILAIIGRNGAGKSTLLKILSQITSPTSGTIKMKGRLSSLLEVGTGFHPDLSGRENIFINGAILGMRKWEIEKKLDEIIEFAGVERYIDTPVKRYSSGMIVRLGFSVAAHLEPEILIVDEVLSVGDVEFQKKCMGKMGEVSKQEGRTILFVSHNLGAVENLCSSGIILSSGKLAFQKSSIKKTLLEFSKSILFSENSINLSEYTSKYFSPSKFFLGDENGKKIDSIVSNDSDFYVYIDGIVEKLDPALQIGISVFDDQGRVIFWSFHTDTENSLWPKIDLKMNSFRLKIPPRFLNEGRYIIELGVALYCKEWIFEPGINSPSLSFEITGGLSDSLYWPYKRPGILAPVLGWEKV